MPRIAGKQMGLAERVLMNIFGTLIIFVMTFGPIILLWCLVLSSLLPSPIKRG